MSRGLPRIVHVASGREWRGGQRQVFLLARELGRLGVDQVVVTTRRSRLAEQLLGAGVAVAPVGWTSPLSPAPLRAALRETRSPTILHSHDGHAITIAALAARVRGAPLVAHRRTDLPLKRPLFWKRAARIIAISEAVRRRVEAAGIARERVIVIPDGVDLDAASRVAPGTIRAELGLPAEAVLAVTVAALTPEKGLADLIEAARALQEDFPRLRWAIAGTGPLRDQLVTQVRDAGLDGRIHFTGWLDDPLRLIAGADLYVAPSRSEGLGTTILDAMALGVPVVATAVGGIPELGGGALVPPADPASLAREIGGILSHPDRAAAIAEEARRAVRRFAVRGMAEATLSVYRSVTLDVDGQ